eukprot:202542_1
MFSQRLHILREIRKQNKLPYGRVILSSERKALLKTRAFIFGISSVNLYALYYHIFRKYIIHQRYKNEINAIKEMNYKHNRIQNQLLSKTSQTSKSETEQILFPSFLRQKSKYSENSDNKNREIKNKINSEPVLCVSNYKSYKYNSNNRYVINKRFFSDNILKIEHSQLNHSNALY